MKKINKLFLAAGSIAAVAAPVAAVVSCGSSEADPYMEYDQQATKTNSYPDSINKLISRDISVAGAWGDARTAAADKAEAQNLEAIGVESSRITNDGIQVKASMNAADQLALQKIFKAAIDVANNASSTELKREDKSSLFLVYSHGDYTPVKSGTAVTVLNNGKPAQQDTKSDVTDTNAAFDAAHSDFFEAATDGHGIAGIQSKKPIKITMIGSNDITEVQKTAKILKDYLVAHNIDAIVDANTDYNAAAAALETQSTDVAFLPVDTWKEHASSSHFIIQAARPTQVAIMNVEGATAALPDATIVNEKHAIELMNKYGQLFLREIKNNKLDAGSKSTQAQLDAFKEAAKVAGSAEEKINKLIEAKDLSDLATYNAGSYEAWIYARKGTAIDMEVNKVNSAANWNLNWQDVYKYVNYGYTSTTSSSSYVYPELWFRDHFTGFQSFASSK